MDLLITFQKIIPNLSYVNFHEYTFNRLFGIPAVNKKGLQNPLLRMALMCL